MVDLGIEGQILAIPPPLDAAQLRSICLLIEHWRACFQDNRIVEDYFVKKRWVAMLNELNGFFVNKKNNLRTISVIDLKE